VPASESPGLQNACKSTKNLPLKGLYMVEVSMKLVPQLKTHAYNKGIIKAFLKHNT
jgi:hypothetical protein